MRPDHINPDGNWFDKERWTRTLRYWKYKTEKLMRESLHLGLNVPSPARAEQFLIFNS
jgi:hypothetical protein